LELARRGCHMVKPVAGEIRCNSVFRETDSGKTRPGSLEGTEARTV
jgi:hypothetical protein